jgi:alkylated DNA repair dioxygenase AlkB
MNAHQHELFAAPAPLPEGFRYAEGFLSVAEEAELVRAIASMPLVEARYRAWTARRRVASYGGQYDFDRHRLLPAAPIPPVLFALRAAAADFAGMDGAALTNALVAEYRPGTPLGWHRDVPDFEVIVGVSLAGAARMKLRRYPHVVGERRGVLSVELAPRSVYCIRGEARWHWQHALAPTPTLRYSITFRTPRPSGR